MRQRYKIQQQLGTIAISDVALSRKSRDEFPAILKGLQHVFMDPSLRESILAVIEKVVSGGKSATGRPGMDLWEIYVLAVVRLGLDLNYDRLEDMANNHKSFRGILGVDIEPGFGPAKQYRLQTLKDNIGLLDAEILNQINILIVSAGHKLVKKKDEAEGLRVKVDGFVIETNIHFPTDIKLLEDSGRKALDMVRKAAEVAGQPVDGWRKITYWSKRLRNQARTLGQISSRGGRNRQQRLAAAAEVYLQIAKKISQKLESVDLFIKAYPSVKMAAISTALAEYQKYLDTHIDLVHRRLLEGETIPHKDKIFSIFEPHTEWISKGKAHKKVELGLNTIIATDQWHFILYHKILQSEAEVATAVPTAKAICKKYKVEKLDSISFDKGFYSGPNYKNLQDHALQVILPKKGKRTQAEETREREGSFVKLRHKHSGVEANINQLEHHGLNKCPDKGLAHFKRYVALGVLAYNLHRMGNLILKEEREKIKKAKAAKQAA